MARPTRHAWRHFEVALFLVIESGVGGCIVIDGGFVSGRERAGGRGWAPARCRRRRCRARHLAFALVQACRLIDPDRIVLRGSVAGLYPMVAARVAFHIDLLQAESYTQPEIVVYETAETGAASGAACVLTSATCR